MYNRKGHSNVEAVVRKGQGVRTPLSELNDLTQTIIGATIYHFASAELGEEILGAPIFSADQVDERKRELKALVRNGIRND